MKDPNPINLTPSSEVEASGWVAEARDKDGHLISTMAWIDSMSINENLKGLGEFIAEYDETAPVQVFLGTLSAKL
ncbi:hypothetical protein [Labrenzia sp. R5_0]|uniref:hypothetical protein n=1 Tax=Labrenzia sp. R5_0 TaxID=2821108 RepID=UPI001ADB203F|nr:hypothetical protein [Labrenzia sp. R5_0]MBO9459012.1 hypothetical protein [Labrenzia sp. R5_0]